MNDELSMSDLVWLIYASKMMADWGCHADGVAWLVTGRAYLRGYPLIPRII